MRSLSYLSFAAFVFALFLSAGGASPAYADMMSACEAEIAAKCSDVRRGRGRIAACLYAHPNIQSAACAAEVEKVSNSRMARRVIPAGVMDLGGTQYEADLVAACGADARKLCPGVTGNVRNLVCLYSRSDRISGNCKTTAKRVLDMLD